jgi:hypothetical protein
VWDPGGGWGDKDVVDFVAASALWDTAPLLQKEDFTANPEPDQSLTKKMVESKYPSAASIYGAVSSRTLDWNFIDPNGA